MSIENLTFTGLSSGSSGNCYYLGNNSKGILIDAGISARATRKFLNQIGSGIESVMGIVVTHNHTDHIRGLDVLTRKHNIPVFTTQKGWQSILNSRKRIPNSSIRSIKLEDEFSLADLSIIAFPVSHDAPETIGFYISNGSKKITIATDLGYISDVAASYIKRANILVIESNYDEDMLFNGRYPHFLKKRISSDKGHLSNKQTSEFLVENISDTLDHICLAHLSKNNNTPEKALNTLLEQFKFSGKTLSNTGVSVLDRYKPSEGIPV